MKRVPLACLLLVLGSSMTKAQTMVSGFAAYSTGIEDFGIGATGEYFIKDNISLVGGVIVYFPKTANNYRKNWFELNLNSHYYFYNREGIQFYGLGGLNYSVRHFKNKVDDSITLSEGVINFNIGTGINYKISSWLFPFSELKVIAGASSSVVLSAGLKVNLKK